MRTKNGVIGRPSLWIAEDFGCCASERHRHRNMDSLKALDPKPPIREADIASDLGLSSRQAARSLFTIQSVVSGETWALGDCHGDKKSYRRAHGSSCSRTFLHAAGFHRHRCDHQHGRVARLGRHRQSQLDVPCNGSAGHTHEKTIGCAQYVQQCSKELRVDPGPAARRSIRINGCRTCRDKHSTLHATT